MSYEVPRLITGPVAPAGADVDVVIIPVAQDQAAGAAAIEPALGAELTAAMARGEFKA